MGIELVVFAALAIVLNVLDSTTTAIGFKQYPDKTLKGEGNPIMRSLMRKNKWLAASLKQGVILSLVIAYIVMEEIIPLRILSILLGLVVLNNTYIILSRAVAHRKVIGPMSKLQESLHLSDGKVYLLVVVILVGLANLIHFAFWGVPL